MSENIEVFPAFKDYLQEARFKVAWGGRGSGKTRFFVTLLVTNCLYYGWRIVCLREIQKSIEDSVMQEIIEEIERRGLGEHFNVLRTEIQCTTSGGVFKFEGLMRNQQKLKGYSNFDCAWVEEAANVSAESWKFLIPTLRKKGSEIFVSFNPESPLDATYKMFVTERYYPDYKDGKRYCITKKINYTENPRFPQELKDDLELMKEHDPDLFQHVYLGEPVANSDLAIIPPKWFAATIDLHKHLGIEPSGGIRMGFDVADEGADFNASAISHGFVVTFLKEWKDNDPNSAANQALNDLIEHNGEELVYDSLGVGAGAKGELRQRIAELESQSKIPPKITAFVANAAVNNPSDPYDQGYIAESVNHKDGTARTNKDMFTNLKAQAYWELRDRCYNAWKAVNGKPYDQDKLISFDTDLIPEKVLSKLKGEASQPRREYLNGKLRVEPKDKMKKRGVASPNILEAVVMAFCPDDGSDWLDDFIG
jgi:phage terminase large subunit